MQRMQSYKNSYQKLGYCFNYIYFYISTLFPNQKEGLTVNLAFEISD